MSQSQNYALLDFGEGRKLEQFGTYVVDRPCPMVDGFSRHMETAWPKSGARFERINAQMGTWDIKVAPPTSWQSTFHRMQMSLALTPAGQVGLFPEQIDNWSWLDKVIRKLAQSRRERADTIPRVLNLFGYTGASTLTAAFAGAEVVHVDSAKSSVQWARRNADLNRLTDHPIRWIIEDAPKFVRRELKRGNRYQGVILDPPTYGHGPKREAWDIRRDLTTLWQDCLALLEGPDTFVLLSSHSREFERDGLRQLVDETSSHSLHSNVEIVDMALVTRDGRELPSGTTLRWTEMQSP